MLPVAPKPSIALLRTRRDRLVDAGFHLAVALVGVAISAVFVVTLLGHH